MQAKPQESGVFQMKVITKAMQVLCVALALMISKVAVAEQPVVFKRISSQFIAALGDPRANSGTGAQHWGYWPVDPGPRLKIGGWMKTAC